MLTQTGRRVRTAVTAGVAGLLLAGTFFGQDDAFPFGPFRMYATRDAPNGSVVSTRVEAVDASGRVITVPDSATGMRRAEIEGQVSSFRHQADRLGALSRAHSRLRPNEPAYILVRVVERRYALRDGRPAGTGVEQVVAQWQR
ncbi:MAG: hypothetical protein NVS3B26_06590 [Mycobacteriales bacterium]